MKTLFTKGPDWLRRWDGFLSANSRGNHLNFSDWLIAYEGYGFDYEVGLVLEGDKIIGGCGVIIPRFSFIKLYVLPSGPIIGEGYEALIEDFVEEIRVRAVSIGSCYLQFSLPVSSNVLIRSHVYAPDVVLGFKKKFKCGRLFKYVFSGYGLNWVDLNGYENAEDYLDKLPKKIRRCIKLPYGKGAEPKWEIEESAIGEGYAVIVENAGQANYSVRNFDELRGTIRALLKDKRIYYINCRLEGQVKASAYFVYSGDYFSYISGGVKREKPDLCFGYMMQYEIIKKSFELGLKGYNISMGGSDGVRRFKQKFGAEEIPYESSDYYIVLKPWFFGAFRMVEKYMKPYKSRISNALVWFRSAIRRR